MKKKRCLSRQGFKFGRSGASRGLSGLLHYVRNDDGRQGDQAVNIEKKNIFAGLKNKKNMPTLSIFFGLIIRMFYRDHQPPHIHVQYQNDHAMVDIATGDIREGSLSARSLRFIQAWVEIHRDDLYANWELCRNGEEPFKIEPLK
jgi:hypothetical protein